MPLTQEDELVDRECCDDDNATIMRATCDEEKCKQEDEWEEQRRAMQRRWRWGCNNGIDKQRARGDDAELEQAR